MQVRRLAATYGYLMVGALVLVSAGPSRALAQDGTCPAASQHRNRRRNRRGRQALLSGLSSARQAIQNVENAAPDYALIFGCVSGGDFGAMGMHFLKDRCCTRRGECRLP